jgi:hypothetical protein
MRTSSVSWLLLGRTGCGKRLPDGSDAGTPVSLAVVALDCLRAEPVTRSVRKSETSTTRTLTTVGYRGGKRRHEGSGGIESFTVTR